MNIIVTDGKDDRFHKLCDQLDEYLDNAVGIEKQRSQYVQYNHLDDIHDVVLVIENEEAVGCGSFKKYTDSTAEIKRIFVCKKCRGKKYGQAIIRQLEKMASDKGFKRLILETGISLVHAGIMYHNIGYHDIENYGQYKDMKDSICMEKNL